MNDLLQTSNYPGGIHPPPTNIFSFFSNHRERLVEVASGGRVFNAKKLQQKLVLEGKGGNATHRAKRTKVNPPRRSFARVFALVLAATPPTLP